MVAGVIYRMKDEELKRWQEIIRQTEDLVSKWNDIHRKSPYYDQICKCWENFIDKQKEEYQYHLRRIGSSKEKKEID